MTLGKTHRLSALCLIALGTSLVGGLTMRAGAQAPPPPPQLPPVPVPAANPITEPKRVLGKILFWDEQLSVDGTMACATCHLPGHGGAEARRTRQAGPDGVLNTADDIFGSPGVVHSDSLTDFVRDITYGTGKQVTGRNAPSPINAAYFNDLFWDGRATSQFTDPETGQVSIFNGGALESQVLAPPTNPVEMAHEGVNWAEITSRIARARPLALATNPPADVAAALAGRPGYAELFARAFGDGRVTADRIAKAIATYERTLISDQTPYDLFAAGNTNALTPNQQQGLQRFLSTGAQGTNCTACHVPPLFAGQPNNAYRNIGLRPPTEDTGRQVVTGNANDRGKFKVPTLRNVALQTSFMHNGVFTTLQQVFGFYDHAPGTVQFTDNQDPVMPNVHIPPPDGAVIQDFLTNALVDPRVRNETFPFDHPTLFSQRTTDIPTIIGGGVAGSGGITPTIIANSPPMIGSPDFRIGLDHALGGAPARLLVSTSPPSGGRITPTLTFDNKVASGSGAGNGVATNHWALTGQGLVAGQTMYAQWEITDPAAAGGKAYSSIAQFKLFCGSLGCALCPADINTDGVLNVQDIFSFIEAWFAGDVRTDMDNSGVIDVQDIFGFLNAWFAGC
jgi:cytochrome c peroxidase